MIVEDAFNRQLNEGDFVEVINNNQKESSPFSPFGVSIKPERKFFIKKIHRWGSVDLKACSGNLIQLNINPNQLKKTLNYKYKVGSKVRITQLTAPTLYYWGFAGVFKKGDVFTVIEINSDGYTLKSEKKSYSLQRKISEECIEQYYEEEEQRTNRNPCDEMDLTCTLNTGNTTDIVDRPSFITASSNTVIKGGVLFPSEPSEPLLLNKKKKKRLHNVENLHSISIKLQK